MSSTAKKFYDEIVDAVVITSSRVSTNRSRSQTSTRSKSSKASNTKSSKASSRKSSKASSRKSSKASIPKFSKTRSSKSSQPSSVKSSKAYGSKFDSTRNKFSGKPASKIFVKKERNPNKNIVANEDEINKLKSEETLLKNEFTQDVGSNTVLSGPYKCGKARCKCSEGRPIPKEIGETKEIQTVDEKPYAHRDKACTHYVETASFGMVTIPFGGRYSENIRLRSRSSPARERRLAFEDSFYNLNQERMSHPSPKLSFQVPQELSRESYYNLNESRRFYPTSKLAFLGPQQVPREFRLVNKSSQKSSKPDHYGCCMNSSNPCSDIRSCERWALSQSPIRGPDF